MLPAMTQSKTSNGSSAEQSAALVEEEEGGEIERKGLVYVYINKYTRVISGGQMTRRKGNN